MAKPPLKVLLVEASREDPGFVQALLDGAGNSELVVLRVGSVNEALQRLAAQVHDAVLFDLTLANSGGRAALKRMLAHPSNLPIVILTGREEEELAKKAVQGGAQDYVVKGQVSEPQLRRSLHQAIERHRLLREQAEQAATASALARVGEELISLLSTPVLVERLCRLTTEVLGGDFTHTWLWQADERVYVPVAHYGDTPEMWESVRHLKVPAEMVKEFLAALESDDVFYSVISEASPLVRAGIDLRQSGISAVLYVAVRRGRQLIGTQACGYKHGEPFSPRHQRIAKGLVHLASLGLENARLVEEIERSNLVKSYVTATLSHELRGALGTVLLATDVALMTASAELPAEIRRTLELVQRQTRESAEMIDVTLEMYGSEVRPPAAIEQIVVADFLHEVVREVMTSRRKRADEVSCHVASDLPPLHVDATKLKMILRNLLVNALKFTDTGAVLVEARRRDDSIRFSVHDSGIGIPPEELSTIFEPFRQAHGQRSRRSGGAGMGLYIVRRLVDMLGGSIDVDSTLGSGSTFHVSIPLTAPALPECDAEESVS